MKTQRIVAIFLVAIFAMVFCPPPAQSKLVTIEIEAIVDIVDDDLGVLEGKVKVGDTITGWYTYDTSTPDSVPSYTTMGRYAHDTLPSGISLTVGGFDFETDPANIDFLLGISNDSTSGGLHDGYWIHSYKNLSLSNGVLVDGISWSLVDYSASALSTISLPTTPPSLPDWETNVLHLYGFKDTFHIFAEVTSAIPEPATVIFLGIGGLLFRKRKCSQI